MTRGDAPLKQGHSEDPALERWLDKLLKQQESSAKRPLHGPWKACPANTLGAKY